jgi:hypothetical protein
MQGCWSQSVCGPLITQAYFPFTVEEPAPEGVSSQMSSVRATKIANTTSANSSRSFTLWLALPHHAGSRSVRLDRMSRSMTLRGRSR